MNNMNGMNSMNNNGNGDQMNNWQQFHGTQLGSMLQGIYGNRPKINYPKPKVASKSAFDPNKQRFGPVNSQVVHGASDPRRKTTRSTEGLLVVPKHFTGGKERVTYNAIDVVPKRKAAAEIKEEMNIQIMRQKAYRPAARRPIGDNEKDRYSQVCAYKGGKGLMADLVPTASEAPFELQAKKKAMEMESAFRATRKGLSARAGPPGNVGAATEKRQLSQAEQLAAQIQAEIDERCTYLQEMEGMDALSKKDAAQMREEIRVRTVELQRLETQL